MATVSNKHNPNPSFIDTRTANAAISKGQAIKIVTTDAGKCDVAVAGNNAIGVALEDAASGAQATFSCLGYCLALVDGSGTAIAPGDRLIPTTGGVFIKATGNVPTVGWANDISSASGDLISIFICPALTGTA